MCWHSLLPINHCPSTAAHDLLPKPDYFSVPCSNMIFRHEDDLKHHTLRILKETRMPCELEVFEMGCLIISGGFSLVPKLQSGLVSCFAAPWDLR
jgi:hypothetical protein